MGGAEGFFYFFLLFDAFFLIENNLFEIWRVSVLSLCVCVCACVAPPCIFSLAKLVVIAYVSKSYLFELS